jgi:signal transduction histidine kinase
MAKQGATMWMIGRLTKPPAISVFASMLLLLMVLLARASNTFDQDENPQVTRSLADARQKAAVVSQDADELEALTRTEATWHAHAAKLEEMKQHINDMARSVEQLQAARDSASAWQRQAIDRMMPLMRELASSTTAAINHLNQQQSRPTTPSYTEYLKENAATAHELANMISEFVEYGQARQKLQNLEQKLEVASK